jgi:hypothetical protein
MEHQQDSGHRQNQKEIEGNQSQPHGGLKFYRPFVNFDRLNVQQDIAEHYFRLGQPRVIESVSEKGVI